MDLICVYLIKKKSPNVIDVLSKDMTIVQMGLVGKRNSHRSREAELGGTKRGNGYKVDLNE